MHFGTLLSFPHIGCLISTNTGQESSSLFIARLGPPVTLRNIISDNSFDKEKPAISLLSCHCVSITHIFFSLIFFSYRKLGRNILISSFPVQQISHLKRYSSFCKAFNYFRAMHTELNDFAGSFFFFVVGLAAVIRPRFYLLVMDGRNGPIPNGTFVPLKGTAGLIVILNQRKQLFPFTKGPGGC